jgi:hypothetical protein
MDGDGARCAAVFCFLLMLPEDLIIQIILLAIENGGDIIQYLKLCQVCRTFRRICHDKMMINLLSLRQIRYYSHPHLPDLESYTEQRFLRANHPEALCYNGMERLMDWGRDPVGQALINQAAEAGDDGAAYFKAMLRYRANPADPEALAIIKNRISGGELPDGRWDNHGLERLRTCIRKDLNIIAYRFRLHYPEDTPELLVDDPHVCIWEECRRYGPQQNNCPLLIRYCSPECRIRHEFDLWTWGMSERVSYRITKMRL